MSLKQFHLFFIATTLGLMGFLLYWAGGRVMAGQDHVGLTVTAAACLFLEVPYLFWFVRRYKTLD